MFRTGLFIGKLFAGGLFGPNAGGGGGQLVPYFLLRLRRRRVR